MREFKVWSPKAENMELHADGRKYKMNRKSDWWYYVLEADKQVDYGFIIDGEGPFPDPRSQYQPEGVHGLSRTADHNEYKWKDDNWQPAPLCSAVIYELHVGTFTDKGTFEGVIEKLDYLKELGITHIELMPVNEFSGKRGWGYDGVSLFAPHHSYGGPTGLKKLVDACHLKNLSVILDVVYNHFGPEGNYTGFFAPYRTDKYKTPWGDAVNFDDAYSNEVRNFVIDNALMWLKNYHIDALRIDAIHAIFDQSAIHILEQLADEVSRLETEMSTSHFLIAESDLNNPRVVESKDIGGYGLNAQWSDDFHHALHTVLTGEDQGYYADFGNVSHLAKSLQSVFVYDGIYSEFRKSLHGRKVRDLNAHKFVACIQNHDQVGNRAVGDRIGHNISPELEKTAAAVLLTSPFIPLIFQGQEWSTSSPFQYFTDHEDSELGKAVTKGRRREFKGFGWNPEKIPDPQAEDTFKNSKLDFSEQDSGKHKEIIKWYKSLISLRKNEPDLVKDKLSNIEVHYDDIEKWLKFKRGKIVTACNFSGIKVKINNEKKEDTEILLSSEKEIEINKEYIYLPKESVVIYKII